MTAWRLLFPGAFPVLSIHSYKSFLEERFKFSYRYLLEPAVSCGFRDNNGDAVASSFLIMQSCACQFLRTVRACQRKARLFEDAYYPFAARFFAKAFGRSSGWGTQPWAAELDGYFDICNENQLLIPQCETVGCLEELDEIAALPQVAGIFIGPFDLSVALGIPGQFGREEFRSALLKIRDCCHRHGKFCMIYSGSNADAAKQLRSGIDSVAVNMDAALYINMYKELIRDVRSMAEGEE
mgnify:CR=1 FL=1